MKPMNIEGTRGESLEFRPRENDELAYPSEKIDGTVHVMVRVFASGNLQSFIAEEHRRHSHAHQQ